MLAELGLQKKGPIILFIDNQSAMRLANNPENHKRTKHINIKYHYIRELIEQGAIQLIYL